MSSAAIKDGDALASEFEVFARACARRGWQLPAGVSGTFAEIRDGAPGEATLSSGEVPSADPLAAAPAETPSAGAGLEPAERALAAVSRAVLDGDPDNLPDLLRILQEEVGAARVALYDSAVHEEQAVAALRLECLDDATGLSPTAPGTPFSLQAGPLGQLAPSDGRRRDYLGRSGSTGGRDGAGRRTGRAQLSWHRLRLRASHLASCCWRGLPGWTGSERQISALAAVATLLGTHLSQHEWRQQADRRLQRRDRQMAIVASVARAVAVAAELPALYQHVVEELSAAFGYYFSQLLRYEPAQDALVLVAGSGEAGQRLLKQGYSVPVGVGLPGLAASGGKDDAAERYSRRPAAAGYPALAQHTRRAGGADSRGREAVGRARRA
jgi:hypothetical protein